MSDDDGMVVMSEGARLPEPFLMPLQRAIEGGASGFMMLPMKVFVVAVDSPRPTEIAAFRGTARMRLAREKSFMLINLDFGSLSFDLVWLAAYAKASGEPIVAPMDRDEHDAFSFALSDQFGIVRALRVSTVAPQMGRAIRRAQSELMADDHRAREALSDLDALFAAYPRTIPEERFHEISDLGE